MQLLYPQFTISNHESSLEYRTIAKNVTQMLPEQNQGLALRNFIKIETAGRMPWKE